MHAPSQAHERDRPGRIRRRPADGIFHHNAPHFFLHPVAAVYDRRIPLRELAGCATKFYESFPSARKRVRLVSRLPDITDGASGKAALARPHSKTLRHFGRAA